MIQCICRRLRSPGRGSGCPRWPQRAWQEDYGSDYSSESSADGLSGSDRSRAAGRHGAAAAAAKQARRGLEASGSAG